MMLLKQRNLIFNISTKPVQDKPIFFENIGNKENFKYNKLIFNILNRFQMFSTYFYYILQ